MIRISLLFMVLPLLIGCSGNQEHANATSDQKPKTTDSDTLITEDTSLNEMEDLSWMESGSYVEIPEHTIADCYASDELYTLEIDSIYDDEYGFYSEIPTEEAFRSMSFKNKLVYCIAAPEVWEQICAESPPARDNIIYSSLPFMGTYWSDRQVKFFEKNRQEVIKSVISCMVEQEELELEYCYLFLQFDGYESFPPIINMYREGILTEPMVLTFLIEMMSRDEFEPFDLWMNDADIFATEDEEDFLQMMHPQAELTEALEEKILSLAEAYYDSKSGVSSIE